MRVRFLSELEVAERTERAENAKLEGQSRIQENYLVEKSPFLAGMLSSPHSLPCRLIFLPGQRAAPLKPHSPGVGALGVGEEYWK